MRTIIGFCGYAGSGKDEAARALIEQRGFVRFGFADVLKDMAYGADPIVGIVDGVVLRLSAVVDEFGWEYVKEYYPESRRFLQRLGTDGGRNVLGDGFWIEQGFLRVDRLPAYQPVVVKDVRFPNEGHAIRNRGGKVYRLHRPGVSPANGHVSDTAVDQISVDGVIINDQNIFHLHEQVLLAVDQHTIPTKQLSTFQPGLFEDVEVLG